MSTDRHPIFRVLPLMLFATFAVPVAAQTDAVPPQVSEPLFEVTSSVIYALVVLAVVQVIFIVSLSNIMRTLGGPGTWAKRIGQKTGRVVVLLPLVLFMAGDASAQAYKGGGDTISSYHLFWWVAGTNVFLFIILMVQMSLLRALTHAVTGVDETVVEERIPSGPTWEQRLIGRLTRQVSVEKEQDILMHHEYDGIRELDNVLPPWWVWLFYGSIAFAVVYLFNAHVINVMPDQKTEYKNEMARASADIAAFMATQKDIVDENTVTLSTDAGVLGSGKAVFVQYCTPCHGVDAAGSETSVGPNLTDPYWLHGGGVKNVFHTIRYGVPEKGMISWKSQLKPAEIAALASYLISLQGTGGAAQKPPQGELWKDEVAPTDSTAAPTDSTALPSDTTRLVAK